MQWRWLVSMGIPLAASFACSREPADPAARAGAGGTGSAADAGGSAGASGGTAAPACPEEGSGVIEVRITGLPAGIDASLIVAGPLGSRSVTMSTTFDEVAGPYLLAPARVTQPDPIVRTLFGYQLDERAFCLAAGETHVVELAYAPVATSHRLWTNNSNGTGNLLGFVGSSLAASAEVEPSITVLAGAGRDVAFDREGNLWSMGATLADPHLMRFPHALFADSGEKEPDLRIDIADISCLPALRSFTFASAGALWVSVCGGRVVALAPPDLVASGTVTPRVYIDGLEENGDLAFDSERSLWVTAGDHVLRYGGERLATVVSGAPDVDLTLRDAADTRDLAPSHLAFDAAGNLWVIDFGGNLVSKIASSELQALGAREVVAEVTIALGVAALLERPAFDESGGLWLALDQGRFGRLAPEQLTTSSGSGEPTQPATIITSPGMGNANRMAFYPASIDLPLYHRHFVP